MFIRSLRPLITLIDKFFPNSLQIEAKTRQEIEEKQTQLRQVVGDSYRCVLGC